MRTLLAALLLLVTGAACKSRSPATSAPRATSPAADRETRGHTPVDEARRLALAATQENGPIDRRIADLAKLARVYPQKLDTFILLGRAWVAKARETSDPGYYLNAGACADVTLDLSPGNALALGLRGLVLLNDHRFKEARDLAQTMVEQNPDDPLPWGNLSDALVELGELDKAEHAAEVMMDLKPGLPAYGRASYLQWLAGDTRRAVESARLAIDAGGDPDNLEPRAWALVQAALLFWHIGDYEGADAGFENALLVVRDYPPALVGRGRVAMARGDAAAAGDLFRRAHERSPLVETAWLLAEARELEGDPRGAEEAFARAEKDGKRGDRRTLSLMYSTRDVRREEALRLAEEEKAVRGDPYTDDALAWALYRNGRFAEAKAAIDRARRFGTKDARLLFHQGAIYIASGDRTKGKKLVAEAFEVNPKFDVVREAEARALLSTR